MTAPLLDLDAFLALPWASAVRAKLRALADDPSTQALAAYAKGAGLSAVVFTNDVPVRPGAVAVWRPAPPSTGTPDAVKSKTMQALDLIVQEGLTPYAAAQAAGITPTAVYRALARQEGKEKCPCCSQLLRDGYTIDRSVLKDQAPD